VTANPLDGPRFADHGPTPPLVSVVTVVFNGVAEIERTIESTLVQTYPQLEYIVVDGGSNDGTQEAIEPYRSRLAAFVSEPDDGVYDAMNKAIDLASGEYLLYMNSGDVFAGPDALATTMKAATPGRDEVIFGNWIRRKRLGHETLCTPALKEGRFNHQAVVYSRTLHRRYGYYASARGFTTADYLWFTTVLSADGVRRSTVDTSIAVIDVNGISAGSQTFSQKHAIDFLYGRTSRLRLIVVLAFHPLYSAIKRRLRGER
jgi:glycosyltransferase involved in cell wall biosynthesis